jgi:YHS domain-containing protein
MRERGDLFMIKGILAIAVLYMLYRMFESERRKKAAQAKERTQHLAATGELVKDPICGAYVEKASSISAREGHGEIVHYFCSYDCRDAFLRQHGITPKASDDDRQSKA